MKICVLTPRFPWPENGGDVLRINEIVKYLKSRNHKLVLVSFCETNKPDLDSAYRYYDNIYLFRRKPWESFFYSIWFALRRKPIQCGYYYSPSFNRKLKEIINLETPDLYISHLLRMSEYIKSNNLVEKSILEMTDALSKTYTLSSGSKSNLLKKTIYQVERNLILNEELLSLAMFPKVVLVSPSDINYFRNIISYKITSLALHTNGVNCIEHYSVSSNSKRICFVGNMRTLQNQDAVIRFVESIFPKIKKTIPDAQFYIVGAEPSQRIMDLNDGENVIVTGFVENLVSVIRECCISVAPVTVAAGIQNKVLIAMGCGVPVVMSSLIAAAIPQLANKENCMICDDDDSFANGCIELMNNPENREQMAHAAYEMVVKNYSWEEKLKGYECLRG